MKYIVMVLALVVVVALPAFAFEESAKVDGLTASEASESLEEEGPGPEEEEEEEEQDVSFRGPGMNAQEDTVESTDFSPDFSLGVLTFGLWQRDSDTISSKFLEYRDIPNGAVAPFFRLQGRSGNYDYDLIGHDVSQADQRYFAWFGSKTFDVNIDYTGIPHAFGNGGRSILNRSDRSDGTDWLLSDTLQDSFQNSVESVSDRPYEVLLGIVQPTLDAQPSDIDIKLQRNRSNIAFSLTPGEGKFDVDVSYFHERRTGDRTNHGTSFGFNNVVETTDPIRYITQDFDVRATGRGNWGIAFAGLHYSDFSDRFDTVVWDNPWRGTDSTDIVAQLAPINSTNGPRSGRIGLPPSNQAVTLNGGTTLFLGSRTRVNADLQVGQWKQNEQTFIPFTTNTAILTPSGAPAWEAASLPAARLDGKIDVLALNGFFTSRLTDNVRVNARYRFYENENNTPRVRFEEGYVRFDSNWAENPRITVPYGWKSSYFDLYGTFDAGSILGFELGYKYNEISREFRASESTVEDTIRAATDLRIPGGVLVRALYEFGNREFDRYNGLEAAEQSFLVPGAPANQTVLRRYDQANKDRKRAGFQAQWTPDIGIVSVGVSYFKNVDEYDASPVPCQVDSEFCSGGNSAPLGLQEDSYETFSLDVDVSPIRRLNVYAYYSQEDIFNLQTGRQSGATIVFDPAFNWSSTVEDTIESIGAGATVTVIPESWFLDLFYRYQKVDGNNAFTAGSGLREAGTVQPISAFDDTELRFFSGQLRIEFQDAWTLGVGGFQEKYQIDDLQTNSTLNYLPNSFFINANNGNYTAWVAWLNLTYSFSL